MHILQEDNFNNVGAIQESVGDGKKKTYVHGIFGAAETKNQNGRIYDLQEMTNEAKRIDDLAKADRHVLGELDHPTPQTLDISLKNVAIKIEKMWMDGNNAMGKALILEGTPSGNILKGLVESGVTIGVSTRGSGQLDENTGRVNQFRLITVDCVAQPSNLSSRVLSIQEQLEQARNGTEVKKLAEAIIHDQIAQKYFQKEMKKFIESLKA